MFTSSRCCCANRPKAWLEHDAGVAILSAGPGWWTESRRGHVGRGLGQAHERLIPCRSLRSATGWAQRDPGHQDQPTARALILEARRQAEPPRLFQQAVGPDTRELRCSAKVSAAVSLAAS